MLHRETLTPVTLELLKSLQTRDYLSGFLLAGGSALSLYYGHRKSMDLDLFTNKNFDAENLLEQLSQEFQFEILQTDKNTLKGTIQEINVDFIAHRYPLIREPYIDMDIKLISEEDIIAMKLNAVSVSGQRSKDFIDIYYALDMHTIADMLDFYRTKYNQSSVSHVLKSLVYFDDVDLSDWPVLIRHPHLRWKQVKDKIEKAVFGFAEEKL